MKKHPAKFFCLLLLMALSLPLHAERVLAELEYFYAPDGTLTGKAFNGRRVNFEYDLRGQLLAVTDAQGNDLERYTYDPAGNRLSKTVGGVTTTYTYDEANQLISSTVNGVTTHYKYDAAGRLVQAGDKSYLYNGRNKVVEVRRNGGTVARFEYNIDGQISKAIYGTKVEEFIWDGLALVWRSGITYVNEPYITGGNPVLAGDDVLFNDMLGSTLAINGDPVEMTSFGETGNPDAFFTGKPMVHELGYAFLFRDYNPAQGKWTTSDPLGYPDGWNNLAYCNNVATYSADLLGAACVINRPLIIGGWGSYVAYCIFGNDVLMNYLNMCPAHYAFLFTDTENIFGYPNYEGENRSDYAFVDYIYYDDDLLREAIANVNATGNWKEEDYQDFGHNCQNYISTVKNEYETLFSSLSENEKSRILSEKSKIENYWMTHFTKRLNDSKLIALE